MTSPHRVFLIALSAAVMLVGSVLPAVAVPLSSTPVACDPGDPAPGEETTCTAEGLAPSSAFTWQATFADESTLSGDGAADEDGVGTLTFTAPEAEEAQGDFTVTVSGTSEDGEPYEESHEGSVGGGGLLGGLGAPGDEPSEEPSDEPSDGETEPSDDGSEDDGSAAPGGDDGQVSPVPSGAVAAGAGGLATGGEGGVTGVHAVALSMLALAIAAHVAVRRRDLTA